MLLVRTCGFSTPDTRRHTTKQRNGLVELWLQFDYSFLQLKDRPKDQEKKVLFALTASLPPRGMAETSHAGINNLYCC